MGFDKKIIIFIIVVILVNCFIFINYDSNFIAFKNRKVLRILSSLDNKDLENSLKNQAKKDGYNLVFNYMGDLDITYELNTNSDNYDAVWISNSLWLYMINDSKLLSESKSISISPVIMGIKYSKAQELGLIGKDINNKDILELIKAQKIKYLMSSVTQTNDGATSYLGFLNALAGSPEVLSDEMLKNEVLINDLKSLFKGVERVSGDEDYLETMFVNDNSYEAVVASESSLININNKLTSQNRDPLYLLYPKDGVPINDSTLAFIDHFDNNLKKENYLKLQKYLRSREGQNELKKLGRRTWYGGVSKDSGNYFKKEWGIDTEKYLTGTKFPSQEVISKAIDLYIEALRKPSYTVFCLDYSGSMDGDGVRDLTESMDYILDYNKAKNDKLQFSKTDKIVVLPFNSRVREKLVAENGQDTVQLMNEIYSLVPSGSTALYDCTIEGLNYLDKIPDDYTKTIIAMTDGIINVGSYGDLENVYRNMNKKIPIYSITFGSAREDQLNQIANLTNAKVFNGKEGLLKAFKEVRGYS